MNIEVQLFGNPCQENWQKICQSILSSDVEVAQYDAELKHWPDELRVCPEGWFEWFLSGEEFAPIAIVRCLSDNQNRELPRDGNFERLLKSPHLAVLGILDFRFDLGNVIVGQGAFSPTDLDVLATRTDLSFHTLKLCRYVDTESVCRLLNSPAVQSCVHLDLSSNEFTSDSVKALANSGFLKRLKFLDLGRSQEIMDEGGIAIARSDWFQGLEVVRLSCIGLGNEGLAAVLGGLGERVSELDVGINRFKENALKLIGECAALSHVQSLDVSRCSAISAADIESFAGSPCLSNIRALDLRGIACNLMDDFLISMAQSATWQNLRSLNLDSVGNGYQGPDQELRRITSRGLSALAASSHIQNLEELHLSRCLLDDDAIECLATRFLANVKVLHLDSNKFGDRGVEALVRCPHLTKLQELCIYGNSFSRVGGEMIKSSPISKIRKLRVSKYFTFKCVGMGVGYDREYHERGEDGDRNWL